jgi:hypothetical protein
MPPGVRAPSLLRDLSLIALGLIVVSLISLHAELEPSQVLGRFYAGSGSGLRAA